MTKPICGKVARVLNEREIAINVGAEDGVTVGMYFDVMEIQYEDIKDPGYGRSIRLDRASEGQSANYSRSRKICLWQRHTETERVNTGGSWVSWSVRSISYAPQLDREA